MSLLVAVESADFNFLLERTGATRGNLSVQISKLKDAGYIDVTKSFKNNYPNTSCRITPSGLAAFASYVEAIKGYVGK
ncbi:MAG: transcriptional regulator [Flavobacteriales bacterium]|nr:transcriptional regulator [Flavobacteriales bacterium]